jgi:hypothetical protein
VGNFRRLRELFLQRRLTSSDSTSATSQSSAESDDLDLLVNLTPMEVSGAAWCGATVGVVAGHAMGHLPVPRLRADAVTRHMRSVQCTCVAPRAHIATRQCKDRSRSVTACMLLAA